MKIEITKSKQPSVDYQCNIALKLSPILKMPATEIADILIKNMKKIYATKTGGK